MFWMYSLHFFNSEYVLSRVTVQNYSRYKLQQS